MTNELIAQHLQQGAKAPMLAEAWDVLQLHCALYINSQTNVTPLNLQVCTHIIKMREWWIKPFRKTIDQSHDCRQKNLAKV